MPESDAPLARSLRAAGFRGALEPEVPLAPLTTWRIGGPAELLATPRDDEDAILAVRWAIDAGVRWRVLGNGSNLLVRDGGVRGLVLRVRKVLDRVVIEDDRIRAGAGHLLPSLASAAAAAGLAGLEFGSGVPGTVGGAVLMNAGWHRYEIGRFVEHVTYLEPDGALREVEGRDAAFAYRRSRFRGRGGLVLGVRLALERDDPRAIRERIDGFVESRRRSQPTQLPSCGSVFLKPPGDFAGRLIDAAGLKGLRVGGIEVSRLHANFFVNVGGGSARDVLELVERVEADVQARFGVRLEREFEVW